MSIVVILAVLLTNSQPAVAQGGCTSAPPARLWVGGRGYVTDEDITPLNVRTAPGTHGAILTQMVAGDVFEVIDGPRCGERGNNLRWWVVRTPDNYTGWIAEGSVNPSLVYFVAPLDPGQAAPTYNTASRYPGDVPVSPGDFILGTATVRVNGLNLRLQPSLNAEIKTVLARGTVMNVYVGPFFHRGYSWWYLANGSLSGWAVDEVNNQATLTFSWDRPQDAGASSQNSSGWAQDDQPSSVKAEHIDYALNIQRQVADGTMSKAEAERRMENLAAEIGVSGLEWLVRRVPIYDNGQWMSFDTYARDMVKDSGDGSTRFEQDPVGTAVDMLFGDPSPSEMADWMGF